MEDFSGSSWIGIGRGVDSSTDVRDHIARLSHAGGYLFVFHTPRLPASASRAADYTL